MKSFRLAALALLLSFSAAFEASNSTNKYVRGAQTSSDLECITLLQVTDYGKHQEEEWHCQILQKSPAANGLWGNIVKIADIARLPKGMVQQFESARSLLIVPGGSVGAQGTLEVPNGAAVRVEKLPAPKRSRRLQNGNVNKRVIVIRVNAGPDASTTANATEISNEVFGTSGDDSLNMVSLYESCSFGQLTVSPVTTLNEGDPELDATGVFEVQVSVENITNALLRPAIIEQLNADWPNSPLPENTRTGVSETSPFDHIMICMPPETEGMGIAYAYVNSWLTVFKDDWCLYPSTQSHELAHNLGLAHSGEGTNQYEDWSGIMGVSWKSDEKPRMCFNSAKSWQLGWYRQKAETVIPSDSSAWSGRLMGIVDFQNPATSTVLLKLETGTPTDYYINFNRKIGFNNETKEGGDQVMLTSQGKDGLAYSQSTLHAILEQGQSFEIPSFGSEPLYSVKVTVSEINLSANPAYADVTITAERGLNINCGGNNFMDGDILWKSDASYVNTGQVHTTNATIVGASAAMQQLYQTERYYYRTGSAPELTYTFPSIAEGFYDVYLHFSEIYSPVFAPDKRVFDVRVQQDILIENIDVFSAAGAGNKVFILPVKNVYVNGTLLIEFLRKIQSPKISGIEIKPTPGIFINAGGPDFHDGTRIWKADTGYFGEGTSTHQTSSPIAGTDLDQLYQTERYDISNQAPNMIFSIPLESGEYDIYVHFAEIYFTRADARVFNVLLEDEVAFSNVDIYKAAGNEAFKPIVLSTKRFAVTDGSLEIEFQSIKQRPKVSAIEIHPSPIFLVKAYWRYCSSKDSSCRFYVENSGLDTLELTSMSIDWPSSPTSPVLPILYQVRQGFVSLWNLVKGESLPAPGFVVSPWETDTTEERQIDENSRKEYIIQFNKDADIEVDLSKYTVELSLLSLASMGETTIEVEQGGPDYVILPPPSKTR